MKKKGHILFNIVFPGDRNETRLQRPFRRFVEPRWIDGKQDIYETDLDAYGIERHWQVFHA